jgi:membrane dipeptidase
MKMSGRMLHAGIAVSPSDAYKLKKEGKIAVFIGIEKGYPLGRIFPG